ncbi:uncharacterized protein LOC131247561 [Magnolia sinica]|uniref:uncharacterized protein LOC131247561 n=1 Tax=Magnolia sinica TaxID=86752 RepID=UPI00265954E2|nr:uncharacterized protein LOC131247561 [Magnolia sinica]
MVLRAPELGELSGHPREGEVAIYIVAMQCGLRLPLHPIVQGVTVALKLAPVQLIPNAWRALFGTYVLWQQLRHSKLFMDKFITKRIPKPSYYKISPYLSLSAFDTTPAAVPEPEQVTASATSPIPFPLQMDPFRILSAHEVEEAKDWYEANKAMAAGKWFSTIWLKDAWVDSEAIDTYIEFLEKRHNDLSIAYPQDCKFCPTYFTQSLEGCLPVLIAYQASKSASERAELLGQMGTAYAIAKQRDKPYAKAIWCYERVYAPINHENSHWFLLVIYPRAREIVVVDSLCTNLLPKYKQKMKKMTDALPILFHATGDSTALEGKKWTVRVDEYALKQDNGYDCGIFVMKYINILLSLMAKKRGAQETEEEQYNRRSKRREDIGAPTSTIAATREKRVSSGSQKGPSTS